MTHHFGDRPERPGSLFEKPEPVPREPDADEEPRDAPADTAPDAGEAPGDRGNTAAPTRDAPPDGEPLAGSASGNGGHDPARDAPGSRGAEAPGTTAAPQLPPTTRPRTGIPPPGRRPRHRTGATMPPATYARRGAARPLPLATCLRTGNPTPIRRPGCRGTGAAIPPVTRLWWGVAVPTRSATRPGLRAASAAPSATSRGPAPCPRGASPPIRPPAPGTAPPSTRSRPRRCPPPGPRPTSSPLTPGPPNSPPSTASPPPSPPPLGQARRFRWTSRAVTTNPRPTSARQPGTRSSTTRRPRRCRWSGPPRPRPRLGRRRRRRVAAPSADQPSHDHPDHRAAGGGGVPRGCVRGARGRPGPHRRRATPARRDELGPPRRAALSTRPPLRRPV